jgi:hypothetical protein
MKIPTFLAAGLAVALLAGCASDGLEESLHSALGAREAPRSQVFPAEQKATYEAARAAVAEMGYRIIHSGAAEGRIDALSGISSGDDTGSSRQLSLKVRLSPAAESGTEVTVSFSEILENDTANQPGMATDTPLHDPALYEVFFRNLKQALAAPSAP